MSKQADETQRKSSEKCGMLKIIEKEKANTFDDLRIATELYEDAKKKYLKSHDRKYLKEMQKQSEKIQRLKKSDDSEPQETIIESSHIVLDGILWEQVHNAKLGCCEYVSLQNGEYIYKMQLEDTNKHIIYVPQCEQIDWVKGEGIKFPEKPVDHVSFKDLQIDIEAFIKKYLQIPDDRVTLNAYYVMLTWLTEKTNTIPYLQCIGLPGSGKSRFVEVFGGVCYHAITLLTPRANHIYRLLTMFPEVTLVVNEDFGKNRKDSENSEDTYRIYCAGWQRKGSLIPRCIGDNNDMKVGCFNSYGPKIICSYGEMMHTAFASRLIKTHIVKKTRKDIPLDVGPAFEEKALELRNKLLDFKLKNFDRPEYTAFIEQTDIGLGDIDCRVAQSIKPLLILSIFDKGVIEFMKTIAEQQETDQIENEAGSYQGKIFLAYMKMSPKDNALSAIDIADKMNENIVDDDKKIKSQSVGMQMKNMGFQIDRTTKKRTIIYNEVLIEALLRRFVQPDDRDNIRGDKQTNDEPEQPVFIPKGDKETHLQKKLLDKYEEELKKNKKDGN